MAVGNKIITHLDARLSCTLHAYLKMLNVCPILYLKQLIIMMRNDNKKMMIIIKEELAV